MKKHYSEVEKRESYHPYHIVPRCELEDNVPNLNRRRDASDNSQYKDASFDSCLKHHRSVVSIDPNTALAGLLPHHLFLLTSLLSLPSGIVIFTLIRRGATGPPSAATMLVGVLLVVVVGIGGYMLSRMCHLSRHSDNVDGINIVGMLAVSTSSCVPANVCLSAADDRKGISSRGLARGAGRGGASPGRDA